MGTADSLKVTILHRQRKIRVDKNALNDAVRQATAGLVAEEGARGEVSFVLVSDRRIHQLNLEFANVDEVTDVLSFSAQEGGTRLEDDDAELGDIIVSVETAALQVGHKDRAGHPRTETLIEELALLFVHGALHLLGYDHGEPDQAEDMIAREQNIMTRVRAAGLSGCASDAKA